MKMTTKFSMLVIYIKGFLRISSHNLLLTWSCDKLKLCSTYKLKSLCPYYHNVLGHQIWQRVDLPRGALSHKVT